MSGVDAEFNEMGNARTHDFEDGSAADADDAQRGSDTGECRRMHHPLINGMCYYFNTKYIILMFDYRSNM